MARTYQVGDKVTVYHGSTSKPREVSTVTRVTGTFYELENGRRFSKRRGGEFGRAWNVYGDYIDTWTEADPAALATQAEQAEEMLERLSGVLFNAGRAVTVTFNADGELHQAGNAALTSAARGKGLTQTQREICLMSFATGYATRPHQ